jgi:hypothetical protein
MAVNEGRVFFLRKTYVDIILYFVEGRADDLYILILWLAAGNCSRK